MNLKIPFLIAGAVFGIHFNIFAATPASTAVTSEKTHVHPSGKDAASTLVNGEIRKIDVSRNRVTIRHEAIKSLNMPAMTMVYTVRNPQSLKGLMEGELVQFSAVEEKGQFVVTRIRRDICEQ